MTSPHPSADLAARRRELRDADTRASSDLLLAGLRDDRWSGRGCARFIALAWFRSVDAARDHPRALAQVTVLHLPFLLAGRGHRVWVLTSWAMSATHLGMLGDEDRLGVANTLTLVRANLPAVERRLGPATEILSLVTDFADGRIARGPGRVSSFGAAADFLADAAFWTWFVARHEPSRVMRGAAVAVWIAPVAALLVASARRGGVASIPRSAWMRPAALVEVVLGARAVIRWARGARGAATPRRRR